MEGSRQGSMHDVIDSIKGTRDAISVKRVFGDAYELDGVTIIPVASVSGGGGGGGGEGEGPQKEQGSGFGTGFGIHAAHVRDADHEIQVPHDLRKKARGDLGNRQRFPLASPGEAYLLDR